MAIFDPVDGSTDPRPRCTGHCCRCFSIEYPIQEVEADFRRWQTDPASAKIPQVNIIQDMLIPLGEVRGQAIFTCKHVGESGDCQIYETRPSMCRDFPGPNPCPYKNCSSHCKQSFLKRCWNWLQE